MTKPYRTFNGQTYTLFGSGKDKRSALAQAKRIRLTGINARVKKEGKYYYTYVR